MYVPLWGCAIVETHMVENTYRRALDGVFGAAENQCNPHERWAFPCSGVLAGAVAPLRAFPGSARPRQRPDSFAYQRCPVLSALGLAGDVQVGIALSQIVGGLGVVEQAIDLCFGLGLG